MMMMHYAYGNKNLVVFFFLHVILPQNTTVAYELLHS